MFALQPICEETVSVLTALFLGADGACVDLGGRSLLFALLTFVAAVFLLQRLVNRLMFGRSKDKPDAADPAPRLRSGQISTHMRQELR